MHRLGGIILAALVVLAVIYLFNRFGPAGGVAGLGSAAPTRA